jgi:hypothetical protein
MPLAASALALLAACTGPMKSKVPDGLAFDCGKDLGKAYLRFGGGGYLPGETAVGKDHRWDPKEQAGPRLRSTAKLTLGENSHDLVAEWTQGGLRYRSKATYRDGEYLIWSLASNEDGDTRAWQQTEGRALTHEDALVGLRTSADPENETTANGRFYAACRRVGRDSAPDGAATGHRGAEHHEPEAKGDEPHRP